MFLEQLHINTFLGVDQLLCAVSPFCDDGLTINVLPFTVCSLTSLPLLPLPQVPDGSRGRQCREEETGRYHI